VPTLILGRKQARPWIEFLEDLTSWSSVRALFGLLFWNISHSRLTSYFAPHGGKPVSLGLPESGERQRRFSSRGFRILLGLLLVSLIGTTFAVNVTINGNNKLEFGQGVYRITSCDQFVNVALKSSSAFADGYLTSRKHRAIRA
jgi:hypothetical protein